MYAGAQIKRIRQSLEFNQEEMANILGISQSYYSSIEKGKKPITDKLLQAYYDKLGVIIHKKSSYYDGGQVTNNYGGIDIDIHGGISDILKPKVIEFKKMYKRSDQSSSQRQSTKRDEWISKTVSENLDMPVMLDINVTNKLILDIKSMNNEITRIWDAIHEITSLENIIESIEYTYFKDVISAQSEKIKYYDGKSFDYLSYKENVINEYKKCLKYLSALEKFSKAIDVFYKEFSELDEKNVINGFFGRSVD